MFQISHLSCYKENHGKKPYKMLLLCDATQHKEVFPWLSNALSLQPCMAMVAALMLPHTSK